MLASWRVSDLLWHASASSISYMFFFFNDTATTEIYTLSLHDALPISAGPDGALRHVDDRRRRAVRSVDARSRAPSRRPGDRKSTRLNSSHDQISYAVFCLKKKKTAIATTQPPSALHKAHVCAPIHSQN